MRSLAFSAAVLISDASAALILSSIALLCANETLLIKIPRIIWLPILYLFILPFRPHRKINDYKTYLEGIQIDTETKDPKEILLKEKYKKLLKVKYI